MGWQNGVDTIKIIWSKTVWRSKCWIMQPHMYCIFSFCIFTNHSKVCEYHTYGANTHLREIFAMYIGRITHVAGRTAETRTRTSAKITNTTFAWPHELDKKETTTTTKRMEIPRYGDAMNIEKIGGEGSKHIREKKNYVYKLLADWSLEWTVERNTMYKFNWKSRVLNIIYNILYYLYSCPIIKCE